MNGKEKCKILKEIRRQIAQENDIDLIIKECTYKGECRGTCPRCESEVRYLEKALERRRMLHKRVAVAGISAGITLALSGCGSLGKSPASTTAVSEPTTGIERTTEGTTGAGSSTENTETLDGEVALDTTEEIDDTTTGLVAPEDEDVEAPQGDSN